MYTTLFWKDVFERVVSTVAQVLLGIITATGFDLLNIDFVATLAIAGTAALAVVLKALIAGRVSDTVSPASLAKGSKGYK